MSEEFMNIIEFLKEKRISILGIFTHHNSDPDAIASVIALKSLILKFLPSLKIELFSSSISKLSKNLLNLTNENFNEQLVQEKLETIVLCDTNNLIQLGSISVDDYYNDNTPFIIIDHHSYHEFIDRSNFFIVKEASSTAEIITEIFYDLKIDINKDIATLLLCGILYDSRRFRYITESTFPIIQFLMNQGGNYDQALSILHSPMSVSEKMARMKGARRAKVSKIGEFIVAVSYISSYESSVARAFIDLGSDIAAVISKVSDKEIRISLRCSNIFAKENKINLGSLANRWTEKLGGSGGGHLTAAGINIVDGDNLPSKNEELVELIYNLIQQEISTIQS